MSASRRKPASRGTGDRGAATALHSRLVRYRAQMCQACGATPDWRELDAAHIVGRSRARTRTWSPNVLALCRACHTRFDQDKTETVRVLTALAGSPRDLEHHLALLRERRDIGSQRFDWEAERFCVEREAWLQGPEFVLIETARGSLRKTTVARIESGETELGILFNERWGFFDGTAGDRRPF